LAEVQSPNRSGSFDALQVLPNCYYWGGKGKDTMGIFGGNLESLAAPDVLQVCSDQVPEGTEVEFDFDGQLPVGTYDFPLISVGSAEEESAIVRTFDADIWNLAGEDASRRPRSFVLA
jgi:hypothetical protein